MAKQKKIYTFCFSGNNGGKLKKYTKFPIIIPSKITSQIQVAEIFLGQIYCGILEKTLFESKMKKFDVVILAGGKGTRIKKLLKNNPKPLSKISHLYFLEYLINNISKFYINKIFIIAGYKGKKISKVFNNVEKNLIPIEVIVEKNLLEQQEHYHLLKIGLQIILLFLMETQYLM